MTREEFKKVGWTGKMLGEHEGYIYPIANCDFEKYTVGLLDTQMGNNVGSIGVHMLEDGKLESCCATEEVESIKEIPCEEVTLLPYMETYALEKGKLYKCRVEVNIESDKKYSVFYFEVKKLSAKSSFEEFSDVENDIIFRDSDGKINYSEMSISYVLDNTIPSSAPAGEIYAHFLDNFIPVEDAEEVVLARREIARARG